MFRGFGTVVNLLAIIGGSLSGLFFGSRIGEKTRSLITDVLGFITLLGAADAIKEMWNPLFTNALPRGWALFSTLFALLIGAIIGSTLNIELRLERLGERIRGSLESPTRSKRFSQGRFVEGFMAASLLFAIGPLAILGSVSDGMGHGTDQLFLKSTLDFFASMAFASTFGIGVLASIIPVGLYQGAWTVIGLFLGSVLNSYQVLGMTVVGGVLLLGIAFRLLGIKQVAVGNLLPALFLAPLVVLLAHQFI